MVEKVNSIEDTEERNGNYYKNNSQVFGNNNNGKNYDNQYDAKQQQQSHHNHQSASNYNGNNHHPLYHQQNHHNQGSASFIQVFTTLPRLFNNSGKRSSKRHDRRSKSSSSNGLHHSNGLANGTSSNMVNGFISSDIQMSCGTNCNGSSSSNNSNNQLSSNNYEINGSINGHQPTLPFDGKLSDHSSSSDNGLACSSASSSPKSKSGYDEPDDYHSGVRAIEYNRLVETLPRSQSRSRRDISRNKQHGSQHRSQSFFSRLIRNLSSHSISSSSYNNNNSSNETRESRGRSNGNVRSSGRRPRSSSTHTTVRHHISSSTSSHDVTTVNYNQPIEMKPLAICGIKNHGNTCFMNAILQCLSHTDLLAEYFVMNHYKIDLVKHNQLNLCKYGSQGEVTAQCALLFKSLWTNTYTADVSSKFKYLVSKHCKQYEGSDQHDAQEFLFFLLDIFHEDLNIATKKKSKKLKQIQKNWNKPDELVAAETLAYHMRCDSSFIHDLFQAQLRSSLVCRSCNNYSNTFDPYMCLSLPVPIKLTHTVIINISYLDNLPKLVKMATTIETQATLRELRDKISRLVKIPERQMILLIKDIETGLKELTKDKLTILELLDDVDYVEIEAIETPNLVQRELKLLSSPAISAAPANSSPSQQLVIVWTNRIGIGSDNKVFGPFFSCSLPREASFKEIQLELMKTMQPILRKITDLSVLKDTSLFRLKVVDGLPGKCYLPEDVDHPLYMPTVDKALSNCEDKEYRGPIHLKLIIEWDLDLRQTLLVDDEDILTIVDDPNIEYVKTRNEMANRASLQDCFDMYFREERLGADNAWMCPACRRRQQCIKKLSLWSTPDVFIIHLKRFRQASQTTRTKLSTLVTFPLAGLDMNPYLSNRGNNYVNNGDLTNNNNNNNNNIRNSSSYILSPWRRSTRCKSNFLRVEDNIYDLYAVCNHHGNMSAGHYTAYCRNITDGKWYSFDDQKVTPISERSVVTSDAYILFYQRSTLSSSSPYTSYAGSSVGSSSSNSFSTSSSYHQCIDHWTYHLSTSSSNRSSPGSCKSHDNLSSSSHLGSSDSSYGEKVDNSHYIVSAQPTRSVRAYSTLPNRSTSDQMKTKNQDSDNNNNNGHSRSISPPIKGSQNSNIYSKQSGHYSLPRTKDGRAIANGQLSPAQHRGIDGKYEALPLDQPDNLIDESQPLPSPSLQENSRYWTVTSV